MAILGVTFMYNSLVLQKHVEIYIFCMQQFDSGTCIRKHTTTGYADLFLKALNATKPSMHTRLALVLYVLVQKASHLRYKILAAWNRAAMSCGNTKGAP